MQIQTVAIANTKANGYGFQTKVVGTNEFQITTAKGTKFKADAVCPESGILVEVKYGSKTRSPYRGQATKFIQSAVQKSTRKQFAKIAKIVNETELKHVVIVINHVDMISFFVEALPEGLSVSFVIEQGE